MLKSWIFLWGDIWVWVYDAVANFNLGTTTAMSVNTKYGLTAGKFARESKKCEGSPSQPCYSERLFAEQRACPGEGRSHAVGLWDSDQSCQEES